ncbi:HMA2 domain-containing protein [Sorangium sp. So ce1036]|uniref:HMA2 domain-containing protein n=1 Tax=Sorangium sp. So ce1036 TaxID=3133328 RepID=UPI003F05CB90
MRALPVLVAHALERRVRLRAPVLAGHRRACERVAEQLAAEPGCDVVTVRPATGSVIVERDEGGLDPERLRGRLAELVSASRDEDGRPLTAPRPGCEPGPTRIARAVAHAFVAINAEVREAMDHRADLGTLLPVFFATAGLTEIGVTRRLPVPAWFNLLWWSLRSFMTFNPAALSEEQRNAGAGGAGEPAGGAGEAGEPAAGAGRTAAGAGGASEAGQPAGGAGGAGAPRRGP